MLNTFSEYKNDVKAALDAISQESVAQAVSLLKRVKSQSSMVYIVGNGGSASTASHFANDLLKVAGVRAVALSELIPTMTAYGNDNGWENMYADQLKAMLLPQDMVVGISCSGFSPNVIEAIRLAREINLPGIKTLVMTGETWESPLTELKPDVVLHVPFSDIRVQEDCHLIMCHAIAGDV